MRHANTDADGDSNSYAYTDGYANCDSDGITELHTVGVAEQGKHAH
jgi:hypothetical protein